MDIDSLAKSEFPSITNLPNLFQLFIAQLIKDFSSANFDSDFITHLKPDVQEIQFAIIDQLEKVEKISKTKLRNLLYRIDISEKQLLKLSKNKTENSFNEILSELIIKRVLQKVIFKEYYKTKGK
ncbi:MAG: hypothetical protein ACK48W_00505 [Bacteroidota bacterium]|jgi:hypothetical protein